MNILTGTWASLFVQYVKKCLLIGAILEDIYKVLMDSAINTSVPALFSFLGGEALTDTKTSVKHIEQRLVTMVSRICR